MHISGRLLDRVKKCIKMYGRVKNTFVDYKKYYVTCKIYIIVCFSTFQEHFSMSLSSSLVPVVPVYKEWTGPNKKPVISNTLRQNLQTQGKTQGTETLFMKLIPGTTGMLLDVIFKEFIRSHSSRSHASEDIIIKIVQWMHFVVRCDDSCLKQIIRESEVDFQYKIQTPLQKVTEEDRESTISQMLENENIQTLLSNSKVIECLMDALCCDVKKTQGWFSGGGGVNDSKILTINSADGFRVGEMKNLVLFDCSKSSPTTRHATTPDATTQHTTTTHAFSQFRKLPDRVLRALIHEVTGKIAALSLKQVLNFIIKGTFKHIESPTLAIAIHFIFAITYYTTIKAKNKSK